MGTSLSTFFFSFNKMKKKNAFHWHATIIDNIITRAIPPPSTLLLEITLGGTTSDSPHYLGLPSSVPKKTIITSDNFLENLVVIMENDRLRRKHKDTCNNYTLRKNY